MKMTTHTLTFDKDYSFEDVYKFIFYPRKNLEVGPIVKLFRRYRVYIVGMQCLSSRDFSFSFSFPTREILFAFRTEFHTLEKKLSN